MVTASHMPNAAVPIFTPTGRITPESSLEGRVSLASAARLRCSSPNPIEIFSPGQRSFYILSVIQGCFPSETFYDGRLVSRGTLRRGDVNVVPLGVSPRAILPNGLDLLHVYLPSALVESCAADCGLDPSGIEIVDPANQQDRDLTRTADAILSAIQTGDAFSRLRLDVLAQEVSLLLLRRWSNVAHAEPRPARRAPCLAPWQVRRITAKLRDDLDRDVGLAELAELVGLSETYLCTAFRNATGLPPHQWQKQLRIERAKELLSTTRLSVTEIGLEVGYGNPGHFATMFRAASGLTPRAWRREHTR